MIIFAALIISVLFKILDPVKSSASGILGVITSHKGISNFFKNLIAFLLTNPKYGKGYGPINHLNSMKIKKEFK